ncbi:DUF1127 domain-containing protein [Anderseniella sp. Alg231-50]|uniref:DUF1127 domain-containing protein n=1 Tax=Anderseniella sp. Alg231-50 TaxID=1922226 RepID=UPI000D555FA1
MKTSSYNAVPRISVSKSASGSWSATALRWTGNASGQLAQWHERAKQRRQLSELNDRQLADIGVSRIDASNESSKPFWQA